MGLASCCEIGVAMGAVKRAAATELHEVEFFGTELVCHACVMTSTRCTVVITFAVTGKLQLESKLLRTYTHVGC